MAKKADYKSIMGDCCAGLWHCLRAVGCVCRSPGTQGLKLPPGAACSPRSLLLGTDGAPSHSQPGWRALPCFSRQLLLLLEPGPRWHHVSLQRVVWGAELCTGVPAQGLPAQGSSPAQPSLLHTGSQWLQAATQGRWRKTQQGLVHIAQMWKSRASCTHWSHWFCRECCSRGMNLGKCKTHHPRSNYHPH